MGELSKFLPRQSIGVCAAYKKGRIVATVVLGDDDGLALTFPKRNPFQVGDGVTVHLDDRMGSEIYTIELKVYRSSYKGLVSSVQGNRATVSLEDFELQYGGKVVARSRIPGFIHAPELRPERPLPPSPLTKPIFADENESSNKLGVLITRGAGRPHSTVMAFLNTNLDDIFLITMSESFKYQNLIRDPDCVFALDHRGNFNFEHQVDWNYTLYEAVAHRIDPSTRTFHQIQDEFVQKNPWEAAFFASPSVKMIHLVPRRIIHQDILWD